MIYTNAGITATASFQRIFRFTVNRLMNILNAVVDMGNTLLVIEHNLEVIKGADWIIDLGPEGGDKGGEVVATGTPEQVARVKKSYTGQYLSEILKREKIK